MLPLLHSSESPPSPQLKKKGQKVQNVTEKGILKLPTGLRILVTSISLQRWECFAQATLPHALFRLLLLAEAAATTGNKNYITQEGS